MDLLEAIETGDLCPYLVQESIRYPHILLVQPHVIQCWCIIFSPVFALVVMDLGVPPEPQVFKVGVPVGQLHPVGFELEMRDMVFEPGRRLLWFLLLYHDLIQVEVDEIN